MRVRIASVLCLSIASVGLVGLVPAAASTVRADASAAVTAYIRGAHLSPDTPGVDVYLTAFSGGTQTLWLSDVGYGDVSSYRRIEPGTYAVSMRPHGAPASTKPALTWSIDLSAGHAYTAAAIGMNANLHGVILNDTLTRPKAGTGLVRVVQASSRAGTVAVAAGAKILTTTCAFGCTTAYVQVPGGTWTVRARSITAPPLSGQTPVRIASESITSVVVLDSRTGGLALRALNDAAGTASTPRGAVNAGGGGTAQDIIGGSGTGGLVGWGVAWLAVLAFVAHLLLRRRSLLARP